MTERAQTETPRFPTTDRLSFRLISPADEHLYLSLYMDDRVMRFISLPMTRDATQARFQRVLESSHSETFKQRVLVAIERTTNEPIGIISIRPVDGKEGAAEGGIMLIPSAQARGFAAECLAVLIADAFNTLPLSSMFAYTENGNTAVERLLIKLGYLRHEAPHVFNGVALNVWSLRRETWAARDTVTQPEEMMPCPT